MNQQPAIQGPSRPLVFFQAGRGQLSYKLPWDKGIKLSTRGIEGTFEAIEMEWDPGNGGIVKPHWRFQLWLSAPLVMPDGSTEDAGFLLGVHHPSTAARMMASFLPAIALGDRIKIGAGKGNNESICTLHFERAVYDQATGETTYEKVERHLFPPRPDVDETRPEGAEAIEEWQAERTELTKRLVLDHPCYRTRPAREQTPAHYVRPEIAEEQGRAEVTGSVGPANAKVELFGTSIIEPDEEEFRDNIGGDADGIRVLGDLATKVGLTPEDVPLLMYVVDKEYSQKKGRDFDPQHLYRGVIGTTDKGTVRIAARVLLCVAPKVIKNACAATRAEFTAFATKDTAASKQKSMDEYDPFADE